MNGQGANPLGFYNLEVVYPEPGCGAWQVKCERCGLTARTSRTGPHQSAPSLVMLINTHVCDPSKRAGPAA
jgi:hypothetical protein